MASTTQLDAAKVRRQADSLSVEVETLRANLEEECRISAKLQAELDRIKGGSPTVRSTPAWTSGSLNGLVVYYPDACRKATGLTTGLLYMLEHLSVSFETKTPEVPLCTALQPRCPPFRPAHPLGLIGTLAPPAPTHPARTISPPRSCRLTRTRVSRRRW